VICRHSRAVFAPDYAPEEIAEIATGRRHRAGLPKEPTGLAAELRAATKRATKAGSRARSTAGRSGSRRQGTRGAVVPRQHRPDRPAFAIERSRGVSAGGSVRPRDAR
jgi:hypothetical protein